MKVMAHIGTNVALIKAALTKGLRVGLFFEHDGISVEYHFIKDPRSSAELTMVTCIMCTSVVNDPLKLSGVTHHIKDFVRLCTQTKFNEIYHQTPYRLVSCRLFPIDWYPCFETKEKDRIDAIKSLIPLLEKDASKIEEEDRAVEDKDRKIREENQRRRDEEFKRWEDQRHQHHGRIYYSSIPESSASRPLPIIPSDVSDEEVSEMLARGFLGPFT